jgi:predicted transposase YbfD/YdcC
MPITENNKEITTKLDCINDPRVGLITYPLKEILFLVFYCRMASISDWEEMREYGKAKLENLRAYLPYKHGIPHQITIRRVIEAIDKKEMIGLLEGLSAAMSKESASHVALDGKAIGNGLYTVSAYATEEALTLTMSQEFTLGNELDHILAVIGKLALKGCTVTIDSLSCTREIIDTIRDKGGEAIIALKANQPYLYLQAKNLFANKKETNFDGLAHDRFETIDKDHGRIEIRKITTLYAMDLIPEAKTWKQVKAVAEIESTRILKGKEDTELRYYILTQPLSAKQALPLIRAHWQIENNLHWMLDVNMGEDLTTKSADNAVVNLATINRIVLAIIRRVKPKKLSARLFQKASAWNKNYMDQSINLFLYNSLI